ncbi:hypothetical protein Ddc_24226 [Ditylenchus destructor]|nr:hypothetical protein Ddc_24226 [Ditylenchus destructor]
MILLSFLTRTSPAALRKELRYRKPDSSAEKMKIEDRKTFKKYTDQTREANETIMIEATRQRADVCPARRSWCSMVFQKRRDGRDATKGNPNANM